MNLKYPDVRFPGWEVVRKLGQGSFGGVYEIQRTLPDGRVERGALKKLSVPHDREEIEEMLSKSFSTESITAHYKDQMGDLVREYSLMQELGSCGNVVTCHDIQYVQQEGGLGWDVYIRMELLRPLKRALDQEYREETVLKLGLDLCNALKACQKKNIIHRDIKPENILVSEDGTFKLTDFGIAKVSEKTGSGTLAGTNGYMAPEVANRQHYGASADLYSLGMVLYWMMNERTLPFLPLPPAIPSALQRQEAADRRFSGDVLPPPVNGSKELQRIVVKACSFSPEKRYRSTEEFLQMLYDCCQHQKSTQREPIAQQTIRSSQYGGQEEQYASGDTLKKFQQYNDVTVIEKKTAVKKGKNWSVIGIAAVLLCLCVLVVKGIMSGMWAGDGITPGISMTQTDNGSTPETAAAKEEKEIVPEIGTTNKEGPAKLNIMRADYGYGSGYTLNQHCVFGENVMREEIISIEFLNTVTDAPADAWDISEALDGSVLGWVTGSPGSYSLFIAGEGGVTAPEDCESLFAYYSNLREVDNWLWFDTSQTTDMSEMFAYCNSLTSLNFNFDTSHVTDMSFMFRECESLEYVGVGNFDTSQVTNMSGMFFCCENLKTLLLTTFDTSNVVNMEVMFRSCGSLTHLNVSSFDTSQVTNMASMFYDCRNLESLDLTNFDTSQVTNMSGMFDMCTNLTEINISSFNTGNVTNMGDLFRACSKLEELDVSNFSTEKVTDMSYMFSSCRSLMRLNLSNFNTENVKTMASMFSWCNNLMRLRLTNFSTSKVEDMSYMFAGCDKLDGLNLENFDFSWVTNYEGFMLSGATYNGHPWEELFQ